MVPQVADIRDDGPKNQGMFAVRDPASLVKRPSGASQWAVTDQVCCPAGTPRILKLTEEHEVPLETRTSVPAVGRVAGSGHSYGKTRRE